MWKATPPEVQAKFKEQAAELQREFKEKYPSYTYKESQKKSRRAVSKPVIPPPNSIFPATTWEVKWDELRPAGPDAK
jgi:hypothetical protein